jgi:methyltransferase (TIGR00027 family)
MADWDIVSGVGVTALGVAASRAIESSRPGGLVNDPYAALFVRAAHPPWPVPVTLAEAEAETSFPWQAMTTYMGARSRFFDEYLAASGTAGIRQATILGAGLDARAFRLDWPPGATVHEIDAPRVLEFKDSVLRASGALPSCERRVVPLDLRGDWPSALREAGFDPARPTAWLAEGLLPYLDEETKESLLTRVHELSAPGSRLAIEHQPDIARMRDESFVRESRKRLDFDLTDLWPAGGFDPVDWLTGRDWAVTVAPITDIAAGYRRPLDDTMPVMRAAVLITARRS